MSRDEFVALIRQLERDAAAHPARFKRQVRRSIVLAYAVAYGIPLFFTLLGFALLILALFLPEMRIPCIVAGVIFGGCGADSLRKRWARAGVAAEAPLSRRDAPKLFEMLDEVSRQSGVTINAVKVDDTFSASARCIGNVFGEDRNILVINPQLMSVLTIDQFRSVVAHECNHFLRQDGRRGLQVFRARHAINLLTQDANLGKWRGNMVSRFNAYTLVEGRLHEYLADAAAARITSPGTAASALLCAGALGPQVNEFWARLWQQAHGIDFPQNPFAMLMAHLNELELDDIIQRGVTHTLHEETDYQDTHPAFRDRVTAMGVSELTHVELARKCVALHLSERPVRALSLIPWETIDRLCSQQSTRWRLRWKESWNEHKKELEDAEKVLLEKAEDPSVGSLIDRAAARATLSGISKAEPLLRAVIDQEPDHAAGLWMLAEALAEMDDEEALIHYQAVMDLSPNHSLPGCQQAYVLLRRLGRLEEADGYRDKAVEYEKKLYQFQMECNMVAPERMGDHKLDEEKLKPLRQALSRLHALDLAMLFRQQSSVYPKFPTYVLAERTRGGFFAGAQDENNLIEAVFKVLPEEGLDGPAMVCPMNANIERLKARYPDAVLLNRQA